jgi:hypothetical protein
MLAVGRRNWRVWAAAIAALAIAMLLVVPPSGVHSIRDFDPVRTADLELRMWQAYYAKANVRLFGLLVVLLREQYHYSWMSAVLQGSRLARAAARFGNATSDYEQSLPQLTDAYYEVPVDVVRESAILRARAAALRDSQAAQPDWPTIARLLDESYRKLFLALRSVPPGLQAS